MGIFAHSSKMLGAPAIVLGAPSNTLKGVMKLAWKIWQLVDEGIKVVLVGEMDQTKW